MMRVLFRPIVGMWWVLLVVLSLYPSSHAGPYHNYQYDMTVPQFTPDGRLLQVEYASAAAADHSMPLIVASIGNDTKVLLTLRSKSKVQERIIVLPNLAVVALSGVLADSLALLQAVLEESLHCRRMMGRPLTASQIAATISRQCQQHAFGGGIRPYGSIVVVAGVQGNHVVTFQTDPSGAITDVSFKSTVVGGGNMRAALQKKLDTTDWQETTNLRNSLNKLIKILLDEHERQGDKNKSDVVLEVALISPEMGVAKLSQKQIQRLVQN